MEKDKLAKKACEWIGIDMDAYKEVCQKALTLYETKNKRKEKTFYKWEIKMPLSRPDFDKDLSNDSQVNKTRASCQSD